MDKARTGAVTYTMTSVFVSFWDCLLRISERAAEIIPGGRLGLVGIVVVGLLTARYVRGQLAQSKILEKINKRRGQAKDKIRRLKAKLSKSKGIDLSITQLPFEELQSKLQVGSLLARDVLLAFQLKALNVNEELNCITDILEDAEARAVELDALSPEKRGPLHGIPLSLKEVVVVGGQDATSGLSPFIDNIYAEDAVILKVLRQQGAVPFARTNTSQGQLGMSCCNPLYGQTVNPHQHSRTCGGSTGGEGALIGAGASILGLGCDMGGSIRIPSHFCGIYGIKPTPTRTSSAENFPFGRGIVSCAEVYGPMGRSVDALVAFMQAVLVPSTYHLDPLIPPLYWRDEMFSSTRPLRIGYYDCDGGLEPLPAIKRCIKLAKQKLEARGHTLVEFHPPDVVQAIQKTFLSAAMGDSCEMMASLLKDDIIDPSIKLVIFTYSKIPYWIRCLLAKLMFFMHPVQVSMFKAKPARTVINWWRLNEDKEDYRRMFASLWQSKNLDAMICPPLPFVAFPCKDETEATTGLTYTTLYNLLDFPCGVVPVGHVEQVDLDRMKDYPSRNSTEKYMHKISKGSEGLPVGVQCVALPFHDEVALRTMKELEKALKV